VNRAGSSQQLKQHWNMILSQVLDLSLNQIVTLHVLKPMRWSWGLSVSRFLQQGKHSSRHGKRGFMTMLRVMVSRIVHGMDSSQNDLFCVKSSSSSHHVRQTGQRKRAVVTHDQAVVHTRDQLLWTHQSFHLSQSWQFLLTKHLSCQSTISQAILETMSSVM
jgi:hypothetical protein